MTDAMRRVAKRGQLGRDGKRTANKLLALVRVLISAAGLRGEANPLRKGRITPYHEPERTRRLNDDETVRLATALEDFDPRWRDYFKLAILTGARKAALLAMR